jgi:hypothetical protein
MLMVMLRDFGPGSVSSGFILNGGQSFGTTTSSVPVIHRQPVVFKSSNAVVHPDDLQRFMVLAFTTRDI